MGGKDLCVFNRSKDPTFIRGISRPIYFKIEKCGTRNARERDNESNSGLGCVWRRESLKLNDYKRLGKSV